MKENLKLLIQQNVNAILLNSTFADTINPQSKISEIITFPKDMDFIKERIKNKFKLSIHQDISNFTVNQLYTMILISVLNSKHQIQLSPLDTEPYIKQPRHSKVTQDDQQKTLWSRKAIFGCVLGHIREAYGRNVQSTEKIANLIQEAQNTGKDPTPLLNKLKELEKFFDIKIDQTMRIYNIGNAAEKSFVAQGKAIDPRIKYEAMEPLWATIHTALSINYWQSVILNELNVRISTYKLYRVKSFQEFEQLVNYAKKRKTNRLEKEH